ncbi:MAG TPA: hypothetical protein VM618_06375, partial [Acidimicrobiia bacterium]|nr:hypothetical protein [Acidimicrobiia bacterium]
MTDRRRAADAELREAVECPAGRVGPCLTEVVLCRLSRPDIDVAFESLGDIEVGAVARTCGVRLPLAALRGGGVAVLLPRLQRATGPQAHRVGLLLAKGPFFALANNDVPENDIDRATGVLQDLMGTLSERWTPALVEMALVLSAEACPPIAPAVAAVMDADVTNLVGSDARAIEHHEPSDKPADTDDGVAGLAGQRPRLPQDMVERAVAIAGMVAADVRALDEVVLRNTAASVGDAEASTTSLHAASELLDGERTRVAPWFVQGFAEGLLAPATLDPSVVPSGAGSRPVDGVAGARPLPECSYASWVGRVLGAHERGDEAGLRRCCTQDGTPAYVDRLVGAPEGEALAVPVLTALLAQEADIRRCLSGLAPPVEGFERLVSAVLGRAAVASANETDALLGEIDLICTRWAAEGYRSGAPEAEALEAAGAAVALARVGRRRSRND